MANDLLNTYIKYQPGNEKAIAKRSPLHTKLLSLTHPCRFNMEDWLMQRYEQDTQWKK